MHRLRPRPVTFKVTPKGASGLEPLPWRLMLPYFVITVLSADAALAGERFTSVSGYVFLSLLGALIYAAVQLMVPVLHARETAVTAGIPFGRALRLTAARPLVMAIVALVPVVAAAAFFPAYLIHTFGVMSGSAAPAFGVPGFGPHPFGG
jgi:hypothetical protein